MVDIEVTKLQLPTRVTVEWFDERQQAWRYVP